MALRFVSSEAGISSLKFWNISDIVSNRIIAQTFDKRDADFIVAKLNEPAGQTATRIRPLLATELCDFRMKLEHENDGPLIKSPEIALLLADLCDFFHFTEGERAIVLGRELILFLNWLDNSIEDQPPEELTIIR
jgi:hypothetical protein